MALAGTLNVKGVVLFQRAGFPTSFVSSIADSCNLLDAQASTNPSVMCFPGYHFRSLQCPSRANQRRHQSSNGEDQGQGSGGGEDGRVAVMDARVDR